MAFVFLVPADGSESKAGDIFHTNDYSFRNIITDCQAVAKNKPDILTFITLWANWADDKLRTFFPQKTGFDISCKLSQMETICMIRQSLFSGKYRLLQFVLRVLCVERVTRAEATDQPANARSHRCYFLCAEWSVLPLFANRIIESFLSLPLNIVLVWA